MSGKELVEAKKELEQYKEGLNKIADCGCTDGHCSKMAYEYLKIEE